MSDSSDAPAPEDGAQSEAATAAEAPEATEPNAPAMESAPVPIVSLAPREPDSPVGPLLVALVLAGIAGLGWYVSRPPAADPGAPDVAEPASVRPIFETERLEFPISGFALRVPKGYPTVERALGTQLMTSFGPPTRSVQVKMAPIYPWLSARRLEKNNSRARWQSGTVDLPGSGIRISLPDHVRWAVANELNTIFLIAGDRLIFISSPLLLDKNSGLAGIVNSFELLSSSYQDVFVEERGLQPGEALAKPTAEVRAKVDETVKALKGKALSTATARGIEAHEENMLTFVGTLMLDEFLEEEVKRLHKPKPVRPPDGHDHDHDHGQDHGSDAKPDPGK